MYIRPDLTGQSSSATAGRDKTSETMIRRIRPTARNRSLLGRLDGHLYDLYVLDRAVTS